MSDPAAIIAELVDVRNVGVHKSLKLTLHVPEEQALKVMEVFGWPTMVNPVPVALARLDLAGVKPKPKRHIGLAEAAALLCKEPTFQDFIRGDEDQAAQWLCHYCEVKKRSEIEFGTRAAELFEEAKQLYIAWLKQHEEGIQRQD